VKFEILRRNANHAKWVKAIVTANDCGALQNDVRIENATVAEGDVFTDAAEGPDGYVAAELRFGANNGCGMNQCLFPVRPKRKCFEIGDWKMEICHLRMLRSFFS
jgi:hypothetical protein